MQQRILLTNARLIDGISDRLVNRASILIEGERFAAVTEGTITPPEGTETIDLTGKTVLPGLIDMHVHTTLMGDEGVKLFLAAGVTAVRDTGGELGALLSLRSDLRCGNKVGPRLYICGPMFEGSASSLDDPSWRPMLESVPTPEEVPRKIAPVLNAGVDAVKLYFTLLPDVARAIIEYVNNRVPVTGHLGFTTAREAVEAGINCLEHVFISPYNNVCAANLCFGRDASMMSPDFFPLLFRGWEEADLSSSGTKALIHEMVERQVAMGTTLDILWLAKDGFEGARNDFDRHFIPPVVLHRQQAIGKQLGRLTDWDIDPFLFDPMAGAKALEKNQEFTRLLFEAGGLIVGGTDAGAIAFPPPGFSLLREMELLTESLGTMNTIRAVTSNAARHMRKEGDIGSVAVGRYADLVVVDGDPLRDIKELRKLTAVYQGGTVYDPHEILAGLTRRDLGR